MNSTTLFLMIFMFLGLANICFFISGVISGDEDKVNEARKNILIYDILVVLISVVAIMFTLYKNL